MSEEDFIKRWSRRKQEAAAEGRLPRPPVDEVSTPPTELAPGAENGVDLSKLPPLDSITAATDITDFLRKGIPAELSRAALRRAWAADPAIRDFVGLAENAWDFTDPKAIPGFGPLESTPEQIGAMVERVFSHTRETAIKLTEDLPAAETGRKSDSESAVSPRVEAPGATSDVAQVPVAQAANDVAAQPGAAHEGGDDVPILRRTHGGALPT